MYDVACGENFTVVTAACMEVENVPNPNLRSFQTQRKVHVREKVNYLIHIAKKKTTLANLQEISEEEEGTGKKEKVKREVSREDEAEERRREEGEGRSEKVGGLTYQSPQVHSPPVSSIAAICFPPAATLTIRLPIKRIRIASIKFEGV